MFLAYQQPGIGQFCLTNIPLRFHEADMAEITAAQKLGESTEQVLESVLGLSQLDVEKLKRVGTVFTAE